MEGKISTLALILPTTGLRGGNGHASMERVNDYLGQVQIVIDNCTATIVLKYSMEEHVKGCGRIIIIN